MKRMWLAAAASASLATATLAPSAGVAAASLNASAGTIAPGSYHWVTTLTPVLYGAGSYVGYLNFNVARDGTISGFFRNESVGGFQTIVGGVSGSDVWLDLGPSYGGRPMNGHVRNGTITGGVYSNGQPYRFIAAPTTTTDAGRGVPKTR